jgi:hypothetical protein
VGAPVAAAPAGGAVATPPIPATPYSAADRAALAAAIEAAGPGIQVRFDPVEVCDCAEASGTLARLQVELGLLQAALAGGGAQGRPPVAEPPPVEPAPAEPEGAGVAPGSDRDAWPVPMDADIQRSEAP